VVGRRSRRHQPYPYLATSGTRLRAIHWPFALARPQPADAWPHQRQARQRQSPISRRQTSGATCTHAALPSPTRHGPQGCHLVRSMLERPVIRCATPHPALTAQLPSSPIAEAGGGLATVFRRHKTLAITMVLQGANHPANAPVQPHAEDGPVNAREAFHSCCINAISPSRRAWQGAKTKGSSALRASVPDELLPSALFAADHRHRGLRLPARMIRRRRPHHFPSLPPPALHTVRSRPGEEQCHLRPLKTSAALRATSDIPVLPADAISPGDSLPVTASTRRGGAVRDQQRSRRSPIIYWSTPKSLAKLATVGRVWSQRPPPTRASPLAWGAFHRGTREKGAETVSVLA
jgi:hypothetical protein